MRLVVTMLLLTVFLGAQGKGPQSIDAEKLLGQVDSRIYYPIEHGLKTFRFRMSMDHGTGTLDGPLRGLYMSIAWGGGNKWRIEVVDSKGVPLKKVPEFFKTDDGKRVFQSWQNDMKGMAQHLMIGVPLKSKYKKHLKKVKSRTVNNKVEYKITMYPDRKRWYTEIQLKIVNGIPRELAYLDEKGSRFVSRFIYSQRKEQGNLWLWTGIDQESGNRKERQEQYEYLTRSKILILSRLKRLDYIGAKHKVDFKVEGLEVNLEFPKDYFTPKKAKVKPTSKPAPKK